MAEEIKRDFGICLDNAFAARFPGTDVTTSWNIFAMALVTTRDDGEAMTPEQYAFVDGFSKGWQRGEQ